MRKRRERKLRKQLRIWSEDLATHVRREEWRTGSLLDALGAVATDAGAFWLDRSRAARLLSIAEPELAAKLLLNQFFTQQEEGALWETALTIEGLDPRLFVAPLVQALNDLNPHRRRAAARALGWLRGAGRVAARALCTVLNDPRQPQQVREEAAESLAYFEYGFVTESLLSALTEPDVKIRFWTTFALGTPRPTSHLAAPALQGILTDAEVAPGNYWSVGREALASLSRIDHRFRSQLARETDLVLASTDASPEELRWAKAYSRRFRYADLTGTCPAQSPGVALGQLTAKGAGLGNLELTG